MSDSICDNCSALVPEDEVMTCNLCGIACCPDCHESHDCAGVDEPDRDADHPGPWKRMTL